MFGLRFARTVLALSVVLLFSAPSAMAALNVHVSSTTNLASLELGDIVQVRLDMTFDGVPSPVVGLFHQLDFDPNALAFSGFSFLAGDQTVWAGSAAGGALERVADPRQIGADTTNGVVRTLQYADTQSAFGVGGAGSYSTVTQYIFFTVIDPLVGTTIASNYSSVLDSLGNSLVGHPEVSLTGGPLILAPEPGTALLVGTGLAMLSRGPGRRDLRRRRR